MDKTYTNHDISNELLGFTIVMAYEDLKGVKSIESLLDVYGNIVLLYPGDGKEGHWTCVFYTVNNKGQRVIEFYDPYGISVDNEFKFLSTKKKKTPRYLANLLSKSRYPIEYNEHKFQTMNNNINTCGRHVVNRIIYSHLPLSKYNKLFGPSRNVDSDKLVTVLTEYYK